MDNQTEGSTFSDLVRPAKRSRTESVTVILVDVPFLVADDDHKKVSTVLTAAKLAATSAHDNIDDDRNLCSYIGTIICTVFPDLEPIFENALKRLGGKLVRTPFPSSATTVTQQQGNDPRMILLIFGQCVLLLFKNITHVSYSGILSNRFKAIAEIAGFSPNEEEAMGHVFDLARAQKIKGILGANRRLCAEVLMKLLNSEDSELLGSLSTYLCSALSWNDMADFTFIRDMLLATNSPVIRDPRVYDEVQNLARAFQYFLGHPYPQFFMILATPPQLSYLESLSFPTLVAVARRLRAEIFPSITQTIASELVNDLFNLHKSTASAVPLSVVQSPVTASAASAPESVIEYPIPTNMEKEEDDEDEDEDEGELQSWNAICKTQLLAIFIVSVVSALSFFVR